MHEYLKFEGRRVATRGAAVSHYPEGNFVCGRFVLMQTRFDVRA